ncbi:hypothetical protein KCP73_20885 [Salmonella enterica subsp. enterica]|nr:hypothetical protein KCP73_20885 [Salmonella enterica subsp. enterica]
MPLALERRADDGRSDAFDMHEAFAACRLWRTYNRWAANDLPVRCFGRAARQVDDAKFNVLGAPIAYGHPFAATGARR